MTRCRTAVLTLLLLLLVTACELRVDQATTVDEDGSGTVVLLVALDGELRELLISQSGEQIDFTDPESWDQVGGITDALPEDVDYTIEPYRRDDYEGFTVDVRFDSPTQLAAWAEASAEGSGLFPTVIVEGDTYRFEQRFVLDDLTGEEQDELGVDITSILDVRMSAALPGEIVETNGTVDEQGVIRWEPNLAGPGAGELMFAQSAVARPDAVPVVALVGTALAVVLGVGYLILRRRPAGGG